MHMYMRAIGFSNMESRSELNKLLAFIIHDPDERSYISMDGTDFMLAQYSKDFAENVGIAVRGEYNEDNEFAFDYYFPYVTGTQISSYEDISIERHAEKESYAGVCDDVKVGVSLIFYLQNMISYLKIRNAGRLPIRGTSLVLSGLSIDGTILLPVEKKEADRKRQRTANVNRGRLIAAARNGDEAAIESLTLEDMDTYANISRKILKQDILTLVDTYFMPYGVECDQYSILGEIIAYQFVENKITGEMLCQLTVSCNDLYFDICINRNDLIGEPQVGRRFKGVIWMQGHINFPE